MAFYQEVVPVQEPYDLGVDEAARAKCAFNVNAVKTASETFEEELVAVLVAAGVGVYNRSIFCSSSAALPKGPGPYLSIVATGGATPLRIQNQTAPAYKRPSALIVARASSYLAARTMAFAAYDALAAVHNVEVTP